VNLCTACGQDFGSLTAFDRHRVGKYPQKGPSEWTPAMGEWTPEKGRRCLDEEEMSAKGLIRSKRGTWSIQSSLERARRLHANRQRSEASLW